MNHFFRNFIQVALGTAMLVLPFQALLAEEQVAEGQRDTLRADADEVEHGRFPLNAVLPEIGSLEMGQLHRMAAVSLDGANVFLKRITEEDSALKSLAPDIRSSQQLGDRHFQGYRKAVQSAEELMLNTAGQQAYLQWADGEVLAIRAGRSSDRLEEQLREICSNYFYSSHGDNAAFDLASIHLDRHEYLPAARLLARVLKDYPHTDVPRQELLLRLAFAKTRIGDLAGGQALLDQARTAGPTDQPLIALLESELDAQAKCMEKARPKNNWFIPGGDLRRNGRMTSLPEVGSYSPRWTRDFDFADTLGQLLFQQHSGKPFFGISVPFSPNSYWRAPLQSTANNLAALQHKAAERGLLPATQLLFQDGRIYYKELNRVVCLDAATGAEQWASERTLYTTSLQMEFNFIKPAMFRNSKKTYTRAVPMSPLQSAMFADRQQQAMAIHGDTLYVLEGPDGKAPISNQENNKRWGSTIANTQPYRVNERWLAAYDCMTGRRIWKQSPVLGKGFEQVENTGFISVPLLHEGLLLTAHCAANTLTLYALDSQTGKLAWETLLCDIHISGTNPWATVELAIADGDVYVATGAGAIIALDAATGKQQWATKYQRIAHEIISGIRNKRFVNRLDLSDADTEVLIVRQGELIVLPTDSDQMFSLDRLTGRARWAKVLPQQDAPGSGRYCLGTTKDGLFIVNKESLTRYDLTREGAASWVALLPTMSGRGLLTDKAIHLPGADHTIITYHPETGKQTGVVQVAQAKATPLGNLYSDGQNLLVAGSGQMYSMCDTKIADQQLQKGMERHDVSALAQTIRSVVGQTEPARVLETFWTGHAWAVQGHASKLEVERVFWRMVTELNLVNENPRLLLQLACRLGDAETTVLGIASDVEETSPAARRLRMIAENTLYEALKKIETKKQADAIPELFAVTSLLNKPTLLLAAKQAVKAIVQDEHQEFLLQALKSEQVKHRTLAIGAISRLLKEEAASLLVPMQEDGHDEVRLESALALADLGDRQAVGAFVELLESENVWVREYSSRALRTMTGKQTPYLAYETALVRKPTIDHWRQWAAAHGETAELRFPISDTTDFLGRTVFVTPYSGRVYQYDAEGRLLWHRRAPHQPHAAHATPGGSCLIGLWRKGIKEATPAGKITQRFSRDMNLPCTNIKCLANGNALAYFDMSYAPQIEAEFTNAICEISPAGEIVWRAKIGAYARGIQPLEDGRVRFSLPREHVLATVDRSGAIERQPLKLPQTRYSVSSARQLANGNVLICRLRDGNIPAGTVYELSPQGEIVWKLDCADNPQHAYRLENGDTLLAYRKHVEIVDYRGQHPRPYLHHIGEQDIRSLHRF